MPRPAAGEGAIIPDELLTSADRHTTIIVFKMAENLEEAKPGPGVCRGDIRPLSGALSARYCSLPSWCFLAGQTGISRRGSGGSPSCPMKQNC